MHQRKEPPTESRYEGLPKPALPQPSASGEGLSFERSTGREAVDALSLSGYAEPPSGCALTNKLLVERVVDRCKSLASETLGDNRRELARKLIDTLLSIENYFRYHIIADNGAEYLVTYEGVTIKVDPMAPALCSTWDHLIPLSDYSRDYYVESKRIERGYQDGAAILFDNDELVPGSHLLLFASARVSQESDVTVVRIDPQRTTHSLDGRIVNTREVPLPDTIASSSPLSILNSRYLLSDADKQVLTRLFTGIQEVTTLSPAARESLITLQELEIPEKVLADPVVQNRLRTLLDATINELKLITDARLIVDLYKMYGYYQFPDFVSGRILHYHQYSAFSGEQINRYFSDLSIASTFPTSIATHERGVSPLCPHDIEECFALSQARALPFLTSPAELLEESLYQALGTSLLLQKPYLCLKHQTREGTIDAYLIAYHGLLREDSGNREIIYVLEMCSAESSKIGAGRLMHSFITQVMEQDPSLSRTIVFTQFETNLLRLSPHRLAKWEGAYRVACSTAFTEMRPCEGFANRFVKLFIERLP